MKQMYGAGDSGSGIKKACSEIRSRMTSTSQRTGDPLALALQDRVVMTGGDSKTKV